jgi:hypothetical protein
VERGRLVPGDPPAACLPEGQVVTAHEGKSRNYSQTRLLYGWYGLDNLEALFLDTPVGDAPSSESG